MDDPYLIPCRSAFEAEAIVAALHAADLEANVVESPEAIPFADRRRTPVAVSTPDRERARAVLAEAEAVEWDDIDVGERTDDMPLHQPGRMPTAAKFAFGVAIAVVILGLAGAIAMVIVG